MELYKTLTKALNDTSQDSAIYDFTISFLSEELEDGTQQPIFHFDKDVVSPNDQTQLCSPKCGQQRIKKRDAP
jgi:hypothetical protein